MENDGTCSWTKSERKIYLIAYGIFTSAIAIWAISMFIEACRARPKVVAIGLNVKTKGQAKAESPSAADNQ